MFLQTIYSFEEKQIWNKKIGFGKKKDRKSGYILVFIAYSAINASIIDHEKSANIGKSGNIIMTLYSHIYQHIHKSFITFTFAWKQKQRIRNCAEKSTGAVCHAGKTKEKRMYLSSNK